MRPMIRAGFGVAAGLMLIAASPELAFRIDEGENANLFVREGPVAAHVLLRSSAQPRILVAFPAGNSGVGLWFERTPASVEWRVDRAPEPVTLADARGRPLHGVRFTASLATPRLIAREAVLSSVRFQRDYQAIGKYPPEVATPIRFTADALDMRRDRVDGAPGYQLTIRVTQGRVAGRSILAGPDGRIALEVLALTGEPPLTPLPVASILNDRAASDPVARNALGFLSYREKFLAGSWRFNTYFGRDTLMSVRLLMPVLKPEAIEAGLNSVLARLDAQGDVAHEEGIGEFALVSNKASGRTTDDRAELDHKMVDDDVMLAPVAATYLLDTATPDAARRYLARPLPLVGREGSATAGALIASNLRFVLARARPFAQGPGFARLVPIKPGFMTGEWRDSNEGLGRGIYAYNVNAVFVPAALEAAARLHAAGLLDPYLAAADRAQLARAGAMAAVWRRGAPPLFRVTLPGPRARAAVGAYARTLGVPAQPALAAMGRAPLTFNALSLTAAGAPVPILNSDEGFALLFGEPAPGDLDVAVTSIMRPFPAGLMTGIGLLVANPAHSGAAAQARFTPAAYHGAVVWSWQQAMLAAGLERQLARGDLPVATRAKLVAAQATLWRAITGTRRFGNSELWSWEYRDGGYRVVPFGAGKADVDESNAAQLWSTVYLAVRPPR